MSAVFVDTAGWMACADAADPGHENAVATRDAALQGGRLLVTSDFVADETLTLLRLRLGLAACVRWWAQINGSPRLRWERIGGERFERACVFFFQQRDKRYSFTDCTSFALMQELQIQDALTTDRHFEQAGFRILGSARKRGT